jgi:SAM-dependent methyltransferase
MDELARQYVISFYDRTLRMFGDRPEALRWTSKGQVLHYEALLDIAGSIHGKSVLDFGCGKGDFYRFLKEKGIQVRYTGCDVNEKLIRMAREKNPGALFTVFDMERDTLNEDFDYVFLCGVFNLNVQGIEESIRGTLKKLFARCRIGLAFNALSSHNPEKDFELHYVSPEDLFSFAMKNLSLFVSIRHDRTPYDFTMFVYKENNSFS